MKRTKSNLASGKSSSANSPNIRAQYNAPHIKQYGPVGSLTQAGSMGMPEGSGMPMGMPEMGP